MAYKSLKNLNIYLPNDPAIPLLDDYSTEMKMYVYTEIYTQTLIATLFVIVSD